MAERLSHATLEDEGDSNIFENPDMWVRRRQLDATFFSGVKSWSNQLYQVSETVATGNRAVGRG